MPVLVSIPYSPWSIRTRLALRAMAVPVSHRAYTPMVSEPRLRLALGSWTGRITLPVLLSDDGSAIMDSLEIVGWASERAAAPLIPAGSAPEVEAWNTHADAMLDTGRARTTRRVLGDPTALKESLPPPIRALGPLGLAIGRKAARDLLTKYPADPSAEVLTHGLDTLRQALGGGTVSPSKRLLGRLTYADVTAAVGLSFVSPHAKHPLGPAARRCWTEPELAPGYGDLLEWRDSVMAELASMP